MIHREPPNFQTDGTPSRKSRTRRTQKKHHPISILKAQFGDLLEKLSVVLLPITVLVLLLLILLGFSGNTWVAEIASEPVNTVSHASTPAFEGFTRLGLLHPLPTGGVA
jgi:hypothetical protein